MVEEGQKAAQEEEGHKSRGGEVEEGEKKSGCDHGS